MTDRRAHHEAIGAAIERAAAELPEGCDLHIEIERGAGTVVLYLPDTDASMSDFEADTFAGQINKATDWAIERYGYPGGFCHVIHTGESVSHPFDEGELKCQ